MYKHVKKNTCSNCPRPAIRPAPRWQTRTRAPPRNFVPRIHKISIKPIRFK